MVVNRRTGQFFIIGALLIIILLAGIALFDVGGITSPQTDTPKHLFDQALTTFPQMVNTAMTEDPSASHMERRAATYFTFQNHVFNTHGLDTAAHTLIGVPQEDDSVSFILVNFRGVTMDDIAVTANGDTQHLSSLPHGETARIEKENLPMTFNVRLTFGGDHRFNHSYSVARDQYSAVYQLRTDGEDQRWQTTRTY